MSKTTTHPPTIAGNDALVEIYGYIPKRILWEILWDAASRLCPVGQQSVLQAKTEPEAPGSLVDRILEEAKAREVWFPKSVAGGLQHVDHLGIPEYASEVKASRLARTTVSRMEASFADHRSQLYQIVAANLAMGGPALAVFWGLPRTPEVPARRTMEFRPSTRLNVDHIPGWVILLPGIEGLMLITVLLVFEFFHHDRCLPC